MSELVYKIRQDELVDNFVSNLIPINDWNNLKAGTKVFHEASNHPSYYDLFQDLNEDKIVMGYTSSVNGNYYTHSLSGWYLWNEELAKQL